MWSIIWKHHSPNARRPWYHISAPNAWFISVKTQPSRYIQAVNYGSVSNLVIYYLPTCLWGNILSYRACMANGGYPLQFLSWQICLKLNTNLGFFILLIITNRNSLALCENKVDFKAFSWKLGWRNICPKSSSRTIPINFRSNSVMRVWNSFIPH